MLWGLFDEVKKLHAQNAFHEWYPRPETRDPKGGTQDPGSLSVEEPGTKEL